MADIGLIGLGVMGANLALNMADHGYSVAVYNRTASRTEAFLSGPAAGNPRIVGTFDVAELVARLERPRRILLMVKAGPPVDATIDALRPHLDDGDIVMDGGNSHFLDSRRRAAELEAEGLRFVGMGISGGEEGARHGPSIMPGGTADAWPHIREIFQGIAARTPDGLPCCDWIGPDGAGHFVKMVHNGIEYGDMQVIAEAYDLMHRGQGMDHDAMADAFAAWNAGRLESYLIEITAEILRARDRDGAPLVEKVLDAAGQKGTGRWTAITALELGEPATLIAEAVMARSLSAKVDERRAAAGRLAGPAGGGVSLELDALEGALYASKVVSYAQGFSMMAAGGTAYGWPLDLARIALLWRAGCIIRAAFLDDIAAAFRRDPELVSLLLDERFRSELADAQAGWRQVVGEAARVGIPVPAYATALAFYDGYRSPRLPANLIQAQRDRFGAHGYERVDRPRGETFHADWATGSETATTTYQA